MKEIFKPSQAKPSSGAVDKGVSGFTLVELSIVIVIIGLIVAGVTAGQSLVKQASLRALVTDINNIKTSVTSFKLQYDSLPGDMANAYNYWGTALGCTNQNVEANNAGCNGNGDRKWDTTGGKSAHEGLRAWQELNRAGLLSGNFDNASIGTATLTVGRDVPKTAINNTAYQLEYTTCYTTKNSNHIRLTGLVAGVTGGNASVTPADGQSIDTKMDDSLATLGIVNGCEGTDAAGSWYTTAQCHVGDAWTLTETRKTCRLFFHGI